MNYILKNKWIYGIIIAAIVVFAACWFYFEESTDTDAGKPVNQQTAAQENEDSSNNNVSLVPDGYYFVQVDGETVNVYQFINGEKVFCQESEVIFPMLSDEDQELLRTGVQLKDEQELANFLENFES